MVHQRFHPHLRGKADDFLPASAKLLNHSTLRDIFSGHQKRTSGLNYEGRERNFGARLLAASFVVPSRFWIVALDILREPASWNLLFLLLPGFSFGSSEGRKRGGATREETIANLFESTPVKRVAWLSFVSVIPEACEY